MPLQSQPLFGKHIASSRPGYINHSLASSERACQRIVLSSCFFEQTLLELLALFEGQRIAPLCKFGLVRGLLLFDFFA